MSSLKWDMLNEKCWAIVGVTDKTNRFGYKIWKLLNQRDYEVYGINPTLEELDGKKIYKSLKDLPVVPTVVNMIVNPKVSKEVLKDAKELGIKNIFFQPGSHDTETIEIAKEMGFNIVMDCVYASL